VSSSGFLFFFPVHSHGSFILCRHILARAHASPASLFHKIQQGHTAVYFPPSMSEAARDILRKLLVREPHLRLTADQLLQDLWFSAPSFAPVIPKAEEHAAVALAELWKKRVLCEGETGSQKRSRESYGEIEVSEGLYSEA
jgi:serine/threonine protein kinase